jgi:hypothetical protein
MMHLRGYSKPTDHEHKIQVALVDYLAIAARPEIEYRAIPNGGLRKIRVAQKLKAEGVRRGTPDLFFCLPAGRIAWLEMKAGKNGLEKEQKDFRDRVLALDHLWAMARSVNEALPILTAWGVLKPAYEVRDAASANAFLDKQATAA